MHVCVSRPRGHDLLIQQKIKKLMPSDKQGLTVQTCGSIAIAVRVVTFPEVSCVYVYASETIMQQLVLLSEVLLVVIVGVV